MSTASEPTVSTNAPREGAQEVVFDFGAFSYTLWSAETIAPDEIFQAQVEEQIFRKRVRADQHRSPTRPVSFSVRDELLRGTKHSL